MAARVDAGAGLLRPRHPGRLSDVLHVVYKDAKDRRASTEDFAFRQMLRPDLPKENIDGEAILWAAGRLRSLRQGHKHLIFLSDGAPADDATLLANGSSYLADHLREVIQSIQAAGDIRLTTVGLGPAEDGSAPVSWRVEVPDQLGDELIGLLGRMLAGETQHSPQTAPSADPPQPS